MQIAAFQCADSDIANREMRAVVDALMKQGVQIVGVVEERDPAVTDACTAGTLRNIGSSASHQIYLDAPRPDTTCRVDASGVGAACTALLAQIPSADLVVLSKFGKLEAEGDGLYPAILAAAEAGRPVLTAVSERYREAWRGLVPDAAVLTRADQALDWFASARDQAT
jgi:hypothetical protein